ncbi:MULTISPECIES: dephospho-CoA kinase [unclassified Meiothermus]|uniref:dephospho-CoA kinase n=1 Tax=unclassified Meiothermus TaxID=370471 RepID=UPI000D7CA240|nr:MULTISPECIES: dephospho-CoA kinase [unclassified Meiothermus]PZA07928.1 dephospho-CoA kinase [Meiothermus sp. Pnk-1]RYM36725.1 dephospho-CoA kinase [Meiothermus sp. PNK-Is4]
MNPADSHQHPLIIGLTGSIGSGKSTVSALLRELGATVLDADLYAREAAEALKGEICAAFPEACAEGFLDRRRLGQRVFADPEAKGRLEALVHPYVRRRMAEETQQALEAGNWVVVHDIPLLFETGRAGDFAGVLVVAAPYELRLRRVMARSGLSPEEVRARDANQLPQEEKIRRATWVIWNDADLQTLRERVRNWYESLHRKGWAPS